MQHLVDAEVRNVGNDVGENNRNIIIKVEQFGMHRFYLFCGIATDLFTLATSQFDLPGLVLATVTNNDRYPISSLPEGGSCHYYFVVID